MLTDFLEKHGHVYLDVIWHVLHWLVSLVIRDYAKHKLTSVVNDSLHNY